MQHHLAHVESGKAELSQAESRFVATRSWAGREGRRAVAQVCSWEQWLRWCLTEQVAAPSVSPAGFSTVRRIPPVLSKRKQGV